jgi:hypothetical protein
MKALLRAVMRVVKRKKVMIHADIKCIDLQMSHFFQGRVKIALLFDKIHQLLSILKEA